MRLLALTGAAFALLLTPGCNRQSNEAREQAKRAQQAGAGPGQQAGVTPMADRVAVIGLLNKRNGIVRDLSMRPGQSVRVGNAIVRLRACEATAPWENERLTGAFLQLDVQQPDESWRRVFSGWVYKESPSLNVVEHPVYDVWPKSCTMTYPSGPAEPAAPVASSNRSSARKSGREAETRPGGTAPTPGAEAPPAEPLVPVPTTPAPRAPDNSVT